MLDGYTEAELVAARTAAAKMGFITASPDAPGPDPEALPGSQPTMDAQPGVVERLAVGETFNSWDPTHPGGNYDPFTWPCSARSAPGLNVSYMALTGDLGGTSYSSARVGLLDERDGWRTLQTWLSEHLHDVVYRRWLRMAALTKNLTLPNADFAKYEAVCWRARGWDWVDPKNDIEAAGMAIDRGLTTLTEVVADRGGELGDVLRTRKAETDLADALGVELLTGIVRPAMTLEPAPAPTGAPEDTTAAQDRQAVLALGRSIDGAVKWQAQREAPTPVINVHPPAITVEAPVVNVTTPDVRIENHPPAVTVEARAHPGRGAGHRAADRGQRHRRAPQGRPQAHGRGARRHRRHRGLGHYGGH
jgi:capsid protein